MFDKGYYTLAHIIAISNQTQYSSFSLSPTYHPIHHHNSR